MTTLEEEPTILSVIVDGVYLDPFRVVLPLQLITGRSDPGVQPEAPSLSFSWLGPLTFNAGAIPVSLQVGAQVTLEYGQGGGGIWSDIWSDLWSPALPVGLPVIPRFSTFTGRITDLRAESDNVLLQTDVICVGQTAEVATVQVGYTARPAETETARVAALATQIPYPLTNVATTSPLIAQDPEVTGAMEALRALAEGVGAFVWEKGTGAIVYQGATNRLAGASSLELQEVEVLAPVAWEQNAANLWTVVEVVYGPPVVAPALRPYVRLTSAEGGARRTLRLETDLADEDTAQLFATLVLRHWGRPYWDAPQILVRMDLLTEADFGALVQMTVNDLLVIHGVTSEPNTPSGIGNWIIEGSSVTYDRDDSGALIHERQYAVSDRARWSNEDLSTTTTATVAPSSAALGSTFTVTATVHDSAGALAGSGTVEVWQGSTKLGAHGVTAGVAAIPVVPTVDGTLDLVVRYTGAALLAPSEGTVRVVVTPVTSVAVAFTASKTAPKAGVDTVTFTATLTPSGAPGSVRWEYNRDSAGWLTYDTSPVVSGKATGSWGPTSSAGNHYLWRATYVPEAGAAYPSATSSTVAIDPLFKTEKTLTYSSTGAASYQQDGDKRSDTSDAYQGYYSSTNGNQKGMAAFASMAGDWGGYTITKVEAQVTTPHWNSAGGGTLILGSHTSGSLPSTFDTSGDNSDRTRKAMDRDQTAWITITDWGEGFATGALRSLLFGPGPSTSTTYYGYVQGTGADRPKIRITGYVWA